MPTRKRAIESLKWPLVALLLSCLLLACDDQMVTYESASIDNGWARQDTITLAIQPPDSTATYDLFLNLRNDTSYPFGNLWLITELEHPEGKVVTDTLEYKMAEPDGTFLGTARNNIVENKLWYKEGIRFRESGTYKLRLRQAMRRQGAAEPLPKLDGVLNVGYSLEKPKVDGNKD